MWGQGIEKISSKSGNIRVVDLGLHRVRTRTRAITFLVSLLAPTQFSAWTLQTFAPPHFYSPSCTTVGEGFFVSGLADPSLVVLSSILTTFSIQYIHILYTPRT